jgi:hypothetical protein
MTYEQLHDLAYKAGVLLDDNPSLPVLKLRVKRASI